jgi:hypothetical protein
VAEIDATKCNVIRRNEIRRSMFEAELVSDLDRFWRITRELAALNHGTPFMLFLGSNGARVCMRDPAFDPRDLPNAERAATILEALRKLIHR